MVFLPKPSETFSKTTRLTGRLLAQRQRRVRRALAPALSCARMPETRDTGLPGLDPETLEKLRRGFPLHMDRQGQFSFEGDPITHPGVVRLFRASLDATEAGEVSLGIEGKWVYLKLDDLPLRALRVDAPRDGERGPQLILDDARRLALDPATLWEEPGAGLRCAVPSRASGRPLGVRLSNTAAIDLSRWFVWDDGDDDDGARPQLELADRRWSIPSAAPDTPPRG